MMNKNLNFKPDWVSHPGETIQDILENETLSLNEFSQKMGLNRQYINELLKGNELITIETAHKLEDILGGSWTFWINREEQYREGLKRIQEEEDKRTEWLKKLPIKDMIRFGWLNLENNEGSKYTACLDFFEVKNIIEWKEKYDDLYTITAFKISSIFESQPESVVTWLRRGELESRNIAFQPWNPERFYKALIETRKVTRIKDPKLFIPKIQKLFSESGVAVTIIPTPKGCPASGATYFISPTKALLILSFRYLSDDHFWFSLFHEAGHLLLHGNRKLFLEGVEEKTLQEEKEANDFAAEILIPSEFKTELLSFNADNWKGIIRFAKKIGIAPGIVVGQLQHRGLVDHRYLNRIKTRFKWIKKGPTD